MMDKLWQVRRAYMRMRLEGSRLLRRVVELEADRDGLAAGVPAATAVGVAVQEAIDFRAAPLISEGPDPALIGPGSSANDQAVPHDPD